MVRITEQIETRKKDIKVLESRLAIESNQLNDICLKIIEIEEQTKQLQKAPKKGEQDQQKLNLLRQKEDNTHVNLKLKNSDMFLSLFHYLDGQVLDDVRSNASLLLAIQETR